ncbi:MAG: ATP-dependent DNA helicase RecG [Candidatus Caenarcaniphilales bacterium]|nr:ATP-dependent DNA helicase RecG [Candidatus Caenarcaniphilales bacterium]
MDLAIKIERLKKAIHLEEDSKFINMEGKNEVFSSFMTKSLKAISQELELTIAYELSKQYEFYPRMDLIGRMELIKLSKKAISDLNITPKKNNIKSKSDNESIFFNKHPSEINVKWVPGIGETLSKTLNKLNIKTVQDLLLYWPREHINFKERLLIKDLTLGEDATIVGVVKKVNAFQSPKNPNLSILNAQINDPTGSINLSKFVAGRSNRYLLEQYKKQFPLNSLVMVSGRVQKDKGNRFQLANFSLQTLEEDSKPNSSDNTESLDVGRIVPIYSLTEGITQFKLRKIIYNAIDKYSDLLIESLPLEILQDHELMNLNLAVREMHYPESEDSLEEAKKRIAFEEFWLMQLPLSIKRYQNIQKKITEDKRPIIMKDYGPVNSLLGLLPFNLTNAQQKVFNEIVKDLTMEYPMNRLVQGDVGSGKTIVALLTMLIAVERGEQAIMMAPTEILAEQHFKKFQELLCQIGIKIALLTGSQKAAERREILTGLANGQIKIAVGTHALIQDGVEFHNLGLAVIDEQHRFGVKQRDLLRRKASNDKDQVKFVDCLHMTATPIPRTLALTMHGNLDLSEIDELPPGRKPIKTKIIPGSNRRSAYEFLRGQLKEGRQAYVVYPLIEESESLSAKAVTKETEKLSEVFKEYRVEAIHGKMSAEEKDSIMTQFRKSEVQMLVGTTVIEVGVDVPNSTIMVIENAERFGLAQLHQLRGRVGRGSNQSYCILFGNTKNPTTLERLKVMEETENGFVIAQKDLQLRGPGEFLGTRQSGLSDFGLASLMTHGHLLEQARLAANQYVEKDPSLEELPKQTKLRLDDIKDKAALIEGG